MENEIDEVKWRARGGLLVGLRLKDMKERDNLKEIKRNCGNNVKMCLKQIELRVMDLINLARNMNMWRPLPSKVIILRVL